MDTSQEYRKWKIVIAFLLLLLFASCTALGISLVFRNRDAHPTIDLPVETEYEENWETWEAPETTEEETEPTEVETEATEAQTEATAAPTQPPKKTTTQKTTTTTKKQEATLLKLHKRQETDNVAFNVLDMFPGDSVTQNFCVRVTHSKTVTLRYHATVRPGFEKLAKVLKVRIEIPAAKKTLYDGLMKKMPSSLNHKLTASSKVTHDVVYKITAYLDTSVNNDYINQKLIADFQWWVEETGNLSSPQTGDDSGIVLWSVVGGLTVLALLALLVVLFRKQPQLARLLVVLILLVLSLSALFVSVYAAAKLSVSIKNNIFQTGEIKINLNGGAAIADYEKDSMFGRFEPGMTVIKEFYIENEGTPSQQAEVAKLGTKARDFDVLYTLYFKEVKGSLADVLDVTIVYKNADASQGAKLYEGKLSGLTSLGKGTPLRRLKLGETQRMYMIFHFPEEAGNTYQGTGLSFQLEAKAVQARNNTKEELP